VIDAAPEDVRNARLCELNVIEQVAHVAQTTVMQDAWARGQQVAIHGWIYDIADGLLRDLHTSVERNDELEGASERAIAMVAQGGAR
jgi:carbonic anhydrase